jgi:hypothetical protein
MQTVSKSREVSEPLACFAFLYMHACTIFHANCMKSGYICTYIYIHTRTLKHGQTYWMWYLEHEALVVLVYGVRLVVCDLVLLLTLLDLPCVCTCTCVLSGSVYGCRRKEQTRHMCNTYIQTYMYKTYRTARDVRWPRYTGRMSNEHTRPHAYYTCTHSHRHSE